LEDLTMREAPALARGEAIQSSRYDVGDMMSGDPPFLRGRARDRTTINLPKIVLDHFQSLQVFNAHDFAGSENDQAQFWVD
jgi:hypothetical protein